MKHALAALVVLAAVPARAQSRTGFAIERYEPTAPGEATLVVDHPWYTRDRTFAAAGLTLDYGHDPLVYGTRDANGFHELGAVVAHQLVGHLDLAASFLDRVLVSASLPVVLLERGETQAGVSPVSGTVGDVRLGALARIWGQPLWSAFSIHAGIDLWIPVGTNDSHAGDSTVRVAPKVVAAGYAHHVSWSALVAYQYRRSASIGALDAADGDTVGSEVNLGAAVAYADNAKRFSLGPEAILATVVSDGHGFDRDYTSLEILASARYNVRKVVDVGLAAGFGLLREPGTPDARVILRVAYAPWREQKIAPKPEVVLPPEDGDHDGIADLNDACPTEPRGAHPDRARMGCPARDSDGDGVFDQDDLCPSIAAGVHADADRAGCPDGDVDEDGVFDSDDVCVNVAAGLHPDVARRGCPMADGDGDQVPDVVDACVDQPGAPDPDATKNGCPGLVTIKDGRIVIAQPILFEPNGDGILPASAAVLQAVANALLAQPEILHLVIEGHTDAVGEESSNVALSAKRARSVEAWLASHGIAADRLASHGYGSARPITTNKTDKGRAANRRVELRIVDGTR